MFIGIDTGHTNVTAVAFDADWSVDAEHTIEVGMEQPADGWLAIPIEERWDAVLTCLDEVTDRTDGTVRGIGLAGAGGGLYPLDGDYNPVRDGVPALDERTRGGIFDRWREDGTRRKISEITGIPLPPGAALVTLRWLKEHEPDNYDAIEHVLNHKDVVRYRLTGELANEISDACFSFMNYRTQAYDDELLELAGVEDKREALPELLPNTYDIAGHTTAEVERVTGIPEGTPVVAGAHDACANTLGVGALGAGTVTTAGGTWSLSTVAIDDPTVDLDRWCCESFLETGSYMLEISMPTGTISLDWFVEDFCEPERREAERSGRDVWDVIEETIAVVDTNVMFHPFLFGNPWGYMYEDTASGSFTGLRPSDGRAEMLRAVYEAIAFMHRWQVDRFDESVGVEEVRFTGGAARSEFWAAMFADVMDKPVVTTAAEESGCLGGALLAAIGVGAFDGLQDAAEVVTVEDVYHPGQSDYDPKYHTFRQLTERLEDVWDSHRELRAHSE
jgi:L-xylulokinase